MPSKTNPKLVVDPDAVLSFAVSRQCFEAIARWDAQILKSRYGINLGQLSDGRSPHISKAPTSTGFEQRLRSFVGEGLYHYAAFLIV